MEVTQHPQIASKFILLLTPTELAALNYAARRRGTTIQELLAQMIENETTDAL